MTAEQIIDRLLEMYSIGCEIDAQVETCGMGRHQPKKWHIFTYDAFVKVADELVHGDFVSNEMLKYSCTYKHYFVYRDVCVFCLTTLPVGRSS